MGIVYEQRLSDSPYVETITRGRATSDGSAIRPAESRWHMVVVRQDAGVRLVVVGPLTTAGVVSYTAGAELLLRDPVVDAVLQGHPQPISPRTVRPNGNPVARSRGG